MAPDLLRERSHGVGDFSLTTAEAKIAAPSRLLAALPAWRDLPLWIGLAIMAGPTLYSLGEQVWTQEIGAHGPIVLAVGGWLLVRELGKVRELARPGASWLVVIGLMLSLPLYAFGRAFDFISLEAAGLYLTAAAALYSKIGYRALLKAWFPVAYLAFLLPPPKWFLDQFTAPLKQFVSAVSIDGLSAVGIPVAHEGVTIYVAQYRLLLEDACSGMNSIVGLIAVSLLYIFLLRGSSLRYSAALTATTIPIAILGNIIRVMTLILLTYFAGDAVAQGFLHETAGLFLFAIDLVLVFLVDRLLWQVLPKSWRPR
jgi:exosortase